MKKKNVNRFYLKSEPKLKASGNKEYEVQIIQNNMVYANKVVADQIVGLY